MAVEPDVQNTRTRILLAGEAVFAGDGFAGATMRAIATRAGVASGLLHYHFDNKQRLYGAIVGWRAAIINSQRRALLADADPTDLSAILNALFAPALGDDAGGDAYGRIMASLMTGDAMQQDLVREHYDPTARVFVDAIAAAAGLSHAQAAWGYSLSIHVLVAGMARTGRTERLAQTGATDVDAMRAQLVLFAAGGIARLTS